MTIEILHRYTKAVLWRGEAETIKAAVEMAVRNRANLREADLCEADLCEANLRGANLCEADLCGANLPTNYHIASLCYGGWVVTVGPTETSIGCEQHGNEQWLSWTPDDPEIVAMHPDASTWWAQHRAAVCAVILDVMNTAEADTKGGHDATRT